MALGPCLILFLISVTTAEFLPDSTIERARALASKTAPGSKNALHRERLALYNLLESPGQVDIQELERHPVPQYIPLGVDIPQQDVYPSKDITFASQVYPSGLLVPPKPIRAPYATTQFVQPIDGPPPYPYQPLTVYAPAYPYVYKAMIPEVSQP